MKTSKTMTLVLCLLLPLAVGGVSGYLTTQEIKGWFATLVKPSFNPPNYLFGPVWTTLYILMGISLYLIVQTPKTDLRQKALIWFGIQLFLNFWWSIIFFKFHRLDIALIEILLMWVSIAATIHYFKQVKPLAGYLNVPYLCWVSFATILNTALFLLN